MTSLCYKHFGLGVQNEAGQRLTEFCQDNALVIPNTLFKKHKTLHMDIIRWSVQKSDWLYSLQSKVELQIVSRNKTGADCGSHHEFLTAKFRFKLNTVGKTIRPFRYDLNQVPYNYTVEVTTRFKGLDLIECLKNYGWNFVTLYRRQWSKPYPGKRKAIRQNGCPRRQITNSWEKRSERQRRKGKIYPFECRVPKNSKEG